MKIKPVKPQIYSKTIKNVSKKVNENIQKPLIDTSMEDCGFFLVDGKVVPIIFPR